MKKRSVFISSIFLCVLFSCDTGKGKQTNELYFIDDALDEKALINEVDSALQVMADGIIQKDAKKIFSIFKEKGRTHYVRNGHIYPDVKTAEKQYARWFAEPGDTSPRKFTFTEKHYDVLNNRTVLFTGTGDIKSSKAKPWTIAYTILWIKDSVEWKAINMHISWETK